MLLKSKPPVFALSLVPGAGLEALGEENLLSAFGLVPGCDFSAEGDENFGLSFDKGLLELPLDGDENFGLSELLLDGDENLLELLLDGEEYLELLELLDGEEYLELLELLDGEEYLELLELLDGEEYLELLELLDGEEYLELLELLDDLELLELEGLLELDPPLSANASPIERETASKTIKTIRHRMADSFRQRKESETTMVSVMYQNRIVNTKAGFQTMAVLRYIMLDNPRKGYGNGITSRKHVQPFVVHGFGASGSPPPKATLSTQKLLA